MTEKAAVFEKAYQDYLAQIVNLDFHSLSEKLGVMVAGDEVTVPFFGRPHRISAEGIVNQDGKRPDFSLCVILFKYLLMCPETVPREDDWVTFKDFKDAAPFVGAFGNYVERPLAEYFAGCLSRLRRAAETLGGQPPDEVLSYDLALQFLPLPRIPLRLLFNDQDQEFPAHCSILFERRAENFLDMECLAMLGMILTAYLKADPGGH